jgi:hypothetical protein
MKRIEGIIIERCLRSNMRKTKISRNGGWAQSGQERQILTSVSRAISTKFERTADSLKKDYSITTMHSKKSWTKERVRLMKSSYP